MYTGAAPKCRDRRIPYRRGGSIVGARDVALPGAGRILMPRGRTAHHRADTVGIAIPEPAGGRWLTINEACAFLGVDQSTLRRWNDSGKVPVFRTPGGHRRYAEADL